MNHNIKMMTLISLGIAVVFCGTYFFIIPNQLGGYMNLGDGFILLFSTIVSPMGAFLIGAVGSSFADVVSGYGLYAPFTFVIKGIEGYFVAKCIHKVSKKWIVYGIACCIMVAGYFLVDWYLQGSLLVAVTGIPTNLMQAFCGLVIVLILDKVVIKQFTKYK